MRGNPLLPQCEAFDLEDSLTDFEGVVCFKENLSDGCADEVTVSEACIS